MILIVGLGNPEEKYFKTYHNVGWLFLDALCDANDIEKTKTKGKSKIYEGLLYGKKVVIAKPLTYMNNSGEAVRELINAFKPEKTLIVYDDIDLEKGTYRFRDSGSAGTHNGMRSVISLVGTQDIPRLRIGTKSEEKVYDLADYVLSKIDTNSMEKIENIFDDCIEKVKEFIEK